MIKTLFIVLSLVSAKIEKHDFKLAHYELSRNNDELRLHIRVDRFDFLKAVSMCSQNQELSNCMSNYLRRHFSLTFNGVKKEYKYVTHEIDKDFIELDYTLGLFTQEVKEINVYNDVLLEQDEDQENIIVSRFHDRKRSFRLNKTRFETTIKY